ncbi:hypothetical protein GCM10011390_02210 [Aureimonas endophytica]|uniref:SPOR domain-containing protein n=1 Tax=Aureimonas endophytica TaxID=2027858 RepID=A0A917E0W8_9HYPH|nr:SPOR domain-containing protein [Aureimonas endophytica]GGD87102.1 hypothetical protein GCM10011390_02210 [Aureimonas endophytica]
MGNMKGLARGSATRGGAPVSEDPFAELEQIFESELKYDARFDDGRARPAAQQRHDPDMDGAFDALEREFETAFESDAARLGATRRVAAPSAQPARPDRAVARSSSAASKGAGSRPTHLTDEEIDDELESVLRNLSAPARPRDRIVVETQSFAPERAAEERIVHEPVAEVDEFEELIRSELAVIRPAVVPKARPASVPDAAYAEGYGEAPADTYAAYDGAPHDYVPAGRSRGGLKRGLLAGGSLAALLLLGGVGYVALHGSASTLGADGEPLLIKADAEPYKIVPKDPGGRAYPNQNKAVYERVASPNKSDDKPVQTALLRNAEEPMELPKDEDEAYPDALPGVELGADETAGDQKDETRITAATETEEQGAAHPLQPRRVKTMKVGPDGRLIANDEAEVASAEDASMTTASTAAAPATPDPVHVATVPAAMKPVAEKPAKVPLATSRPTPAPTPAAPVAEAPAQPVQVASALPAGGYFVQISSQPNEAAAQQSMASLSGRFSSVIAGRSVGIQPAEIPGKGTYYRVRVAAGSKDEAATLCSRLKSAGATCIVTR